LRLSPRPENATERLALLLNLAPVPLGQAMFGMASTRALLSAVRLGVFARLARGPASDGELAAHAAMQLEGARLLLQVLAVDGHVTGDGTRWTLAKDARPWLDPESPASIHAFLEHAADYWGWWDRLDDVLRTGRCVDIHSSTPDDPHWARYIRGQWQLARLSAPEVARALRLPAAPQSLLDVAGAHGWFSAELCRRHPTLRALVVDLPGSAAVGREIIAGAGLSDRVQHRDGDMFAADLGGPHDAALCFNIIHHLQPEQIVALFRRVHDALRPGATLAVLDLFTPPRGQRPDSAAYVSLFFYLTSGAGSYAPERLRGWLGEAGFVGMRRVRIRRIPGQTLYEARRA
jgi:hypothetical protein